MATMETNFMDGLFEVLCTVGEDTVHELLRATFGRLPETAVPLICGDLYADEVLCYARVLFEMGQDGQARELLVEVVRHAAGEQPRYVDLAPVELSIAA